MDDRSPPVTTSLGFALRKESKRGKGARQRSQPPERKARILIVDNDPSLRRLLTARLVAANYDVESAEGATIALDACVRRRPHLVITDLRMSPMSGLGLLKELKTRWPDVSVIILTAHGTIPQAVEATQCGAFGFLVKPVEKCELLGQVERAIAASNFSHAKGDWRASIVSRSQLMEDRLGQASRAAQCDEPVLLIGENGTGRELFARAIHAASTRRDKPFIVINCRVAESNALEAAPLGRGDSASCAPAAFQLGANQFAHEGTLLMDEIGYLPLRHQLALLHALRGYPHDPASQAGAARNKTRIISTTSIDLRQRMNDGELLEDLYYELMILTIEVPPLGRRREDIPLLVSRFLEQVTEKGSEAKIYSPGAMELLSTVGWPGNVRQLFDLIKQNVALSSGKVMTEQFVKDSLRADSTVLPSYDKALDSFSLGFLTRNLQSTSGNVSASARLAKRGRTDFYKLLSRYRLFPNDFKKIPPVSHNEASDGPALLDPDD
jgi:two-component system, NtrC family, response regulator GlrR